ncbi:MAG: class I SAM-dependent methyltransferase, partial [Actinomycetota bacterium]|nr:class I SAM-dependent methyltransferase [Actinomycetota bacterium]
MTAPSTCGICSGHLHFRYPGEAPATGSDAFAPSCHAVSSHGDLYECALCGTVQQPDLPSGSELHELYRDMRDDAYLAEEVGRRRTARRLLAAIERHGTRGRMLEVGCGHGLLLDEARARDWQVAGLEIADASRAHARDALGLDVRAATLDEVDPASGGGLQAIVMSDVLEHLDDPVAALARCAQLLAPGGIACIVTPDPASLTARLAGRRWWGYLRSHAYLVPHSTLRELLRAAGLEPVEEKHLLRTFSFGYWVAGLGERSGPLSRTLAA